MRLHLVVRGNVQGVGYRWFVRENALRLGLTGWVSNLPDGSVEMELEGENAGLAQFKKTARSGHPLARVEKMEERALEDKKDGRGFEIR